MYVVTKEPMAQHIQKKEYYFIYSKQAISFFLLLCADMCYPVEEDDKGHLITEAGGIGYDYRITLTEV